MTLQTRLIRWRLRRGTSAQWSAKNPVLMEGEAGLDKTLNRVKYGDGVTPWNSLAWPAGSGTTTVSTGPTPPTESTPGPFYIQKED